MRPIAIILAVLLAGVSVAAAEVKVGDRAPELTGAKDARGKAFKLKALRGKWVVAAIAVAVLATSGVVATRLGSEFVPKLDEGAIALQAIRLPSVSLDV